MPITQVQTEMIANSGTVRIASLNLSANANIAGATITSLVANGVIPTTNYASFDAAVAAAKPNGSTILVCSNTSMLANTTVPPNVALLFVNNGVIHNTNPLIYLTITGPVQAPATRLFSDTIEVYIPGTNSYVTELYPQWWGAAGNSSGSVGSGNDDTDAFNRALVSRCAVYERYQILVAGNTIPNPTVSTLLTVPAGRYRTSNSIFMRFPSTHIQGAGRGATYFYYDPPVSNTSCIRMECYKGYSHASNTQLFFCTVKDISIAMTSNTYSKIGIEMNNVGNCELERISMSHPVATYPDNAGRLSDVSHGTIGLRMRGRDGCSFKDLKIAADYPLVIEQNPSGHNPLNTVEDLDHYNFHNLMCQPFNNRMHVPGYANGHYSITIQSGCNLSDVSFTGWQAYVGGAGGVYWNDTTSTVASFAVRWENVRVEQGTDPNGWSFYIRHNYLLNQLSFRNCYGGSAHWDGIVTVDGSFNMGSYYIRNCNAVSFEDVTTSNGYSRTIDVDDTVTGVTAKNCLWATGNPAEYPYFQSQVSAVGQVMVWGSPQEPRTSNRMLAPNFIWSRANNTSCRLTIGSNVALSGQGTQCLSGANLTIGQRQTTGMLTVSTSNGYSALVSLGGTNQKVVILANTESKFSNTFNNSGTFNIFYAPATAADQLFTGSPLGTPGYLFQNNLGAGACNVRWTLMGAYDGIHNFS